MNRKVFGFLAALAVLPLLWCEGVHGLEEEWHNVFPSSPGEPRTIRLSLQSAVELGIKRNLDVVIEQYREKAVVERINEEQSIFDPVATLRVEREEFQRPVAEVFYEDGYVVDNSDRSVFGLQSKIPTGATLGMDFSFERNESTSNIQTISPRYTSRLNFTLVHPLLKDFGVGITKTRIRLAEKGGEKARYEVLDQVSQTVGAVEEAYWDLAYMLENLRLKRQGLDLAKKLFYETEIMVRAGERSQIDLIQADTGVAVREEEVIVAESDAMKAEYDLMLLLDLPGEEGMRIVPLNLPEKSSTIPDMETSLRLARENHPQLKARQVDLEQQNMRVTYARNQLLPRLDFVAEYGYNGLSGDPSDEGAGDSVKGTVFEGKTAPEDAFRNWFSGDAFETWVVGVKFEAPWGNREAKSRYTQAALDEKRLKTERRRLEEQIASRVKKAILDIRSAVKRMEASGSAAELARKQLDAEETRFLAGAASSSDVLRFQEDLTNMKTRELKALIDYNTAWSTLRVVEGVALEHYDIEFERE